MRIEQAGGVQALPVEAHAVAVHHLRLQAFQRDRRPDRRAVEMGRDGDVLDRRAERAQPLGRVAHLLVDVALALGPGEALGHHADAQAGDAAAERSRVLVHAHVVLARVEPVRARRSPPGTARCRRPSASSGRCDRSWPRSASPRCRAPARASASCRSSRTSTTGMRIEPPWSPPMAMSTSPEPTSAPEPDDDPPAE